jgi:hypothetical protein
MLVQSYYKFYELIEIQLRTDDCYKSNVGQSDKVTRCLPKNLDSDSPQVSQSCPLNINKKASQVRV